MERIDEVVRQDGGITDGETFIVVQKSVPRSLTRELGIGTHGVVHQVAAPENRVPVPSVDFEICAYYGSVVEVVDWCSKPIAEKIQPVEAARGIGIREIRKMLQHRLVRAN